MNGVNHTNTLEEVSDKNVTYIYILVPGFIIRVHQTWLTELSHSSYIEFLKLLFIQKSTVLQLSDRLR